ncbi:MAG TPA: CoA transferase [Stellaceae bacterium]|nr:CoA transferase [Stellaceae bacterium]
MLEGIRVIDLGAFITAPLAGMMLADLGADVIKIEPPEGDAFRRGHGGSYSATFVAYNRNKRSLVLDLNDAKARATFAALVARADVLIDNFRPSALKKLGLDSDALRAANPRLVHCSITGFGTTGPYRDRPAFDAVGQALSGIASLFVDPAAPHCFGPTIADNVTGMYACTGILGALVERNRTGCGRRIEVNMLEASMAFVPDAFTNLTRSGIEDNRFSRVSRSQSFAFRCGDGRLIALQLSTREKFWLELLGALGAEDLATDARFAAHQRRVDNFHALEEALAPHFAARPRAEWMARLAATDVPFAPINTLADALADPQVEALGTKVVLRHPREGEIVTIACPILADGARPRARMSAPPTLGEHSEEVLAELARDQAGDQSGGGALGKVST